MKVPVSTIGRVQEVDVANCSGIVYYDSVARIHTVVKPSIFYNSYTDRSPYRIAGLFGGDWLDYNNQFIIQSAGCPLKCFYCGVDNLMPDVWMSAGEMVEKYGVFKERVESLYDFRLNVFHFLGGDPAQFCDFWPELRKELDNNGFEDTILFSNALLVENALFGVKPWKYLKKRKRLDNFVLEGSLKGNTRKNFFDNTGEDLYEDAVKELKNYAGCDNFYLTLVNPDSDVLDDLYKIISSDRVDLLSILNNEVSLRRRDGSLELF